MPSTGSAILTAIFALASFLSGMYILYQLFQERGGMRALLGFFFPPYPYFWGWINAKRLEIIDIMAFWTFVSLALVVFPMAMGLTTLNNFTTTTTPIDTGPASFASDVVSRGGVSPGSQVSGQIDEAFGVEEWTLSGSAGQRITVWCTPVAGSDTDPRLTILDSNGNVLATDDDGGGGKTASITDLTLPDTGTYKIQVDVWFAGPYVLGVE